MTETLQKACNLYGQRETARKIGMSASTINRILKGTYPKPEHILERVVKVFSELREDKRECPALGEIHIDVCSRYRVWAEQDKVHRDRLYMQVKEHCKECKRS